MAEDDRMLMLSKMKLGEAEDAYKASKITETEYRGHRLGHILLVSGRLEGSTDHVPTRVVARALVEIKGENPNDFPELKLPK